MMAIFRSFPMARAGAVMATVWFITKLTVLIALVVPSVLLVLVLGFSSGWSFGEASHWWFEAQASAQQLGQSDTPGNVLLSVCSQPEQPALPPVSVICESRSVVDVPVSTAAAEAGSHLARIYLVFVLISAIVVVLCMGPAACRAGSSLRNRLLDGGAH